MTWYWFIAFVIMSVFGLLLSASYNRLRADRDRWRRKAEWLAGECSHNGCPEPYNSSDCEWIEIVTRPCDMCWLEAAEAATKEDTDDKETD